MPGVKIIGVAATAMTILYRFAASLRAYTLQVSLLLLSLLGVTATSLVNPAVIRTVIDEGLLDRSAVALAEAALVIVAVGLRARCLALRGATLASGW